MKLFKSLCFMAAVICAGCSSNGSGNKLDGEIYEGDKTILSYAKGFSIETSDDGFLVEVYNPWQGAKNISYRYNLVNRNYKEKSDSIENLIPIPVSRVVCLSTTHIAFIDLLNSSEIIVGVSGLNYVSSPSVRKMISEGKISDVGYEQSINYELVLSLKPDVVFSYGVGAEAAGYLHKFYDLKIPVVFVGDYLEDSPLGKAEWIKFFGLLVGKQDLADSLFASIENEYLKTKNLVDEAASKPKVFVNLPWNETWYFPGGSSYLANLISDAGGDYLLNSLEGNGSHPFSIESAMVKGMNADIWINTGSAESLTEIHAKFPRLAVLPVLKNRMVFNSNKRINSLGGNDFYESAAVKPNLVLKDLVKIFYPDSISHELVYFQKLE